MYNNAKILRVGESQAWRNCMRFVAIMLLLFSSVVTNAQCAMCRAALTSKDNSTQAAAVNDGIVYLMVIPYVLVAGIGYAIYRMKKKK